MLTKSELLKILALFRHTGREGSSLLERAKEHLLEDPLVFKYEPYLIFANGKVYGSCKCPYHQKTKKICKHMVAKLIYLHRELLETEPDWQEFMEKYKKALKQELSKISGEVPEEFGYF